jgi:hypothetical protein
MPHDDGLNELSVALTAAGIVNQLFHDCIHITFQKENAMIDIKAWEDGGRSVQIFQEGKWHNLVTVPGEFECQPHDAVSRLIKKFTERGLESSHASNRIHKA